MIGPLKYNFSFTVCPERGNYRQLPCNVGYFRHLIAKQSIRGLSLFNLPPLKNVGVHIKFSRPPLFPFLLFRQRPISCDKTPLFLVYLSKSRILKKIENA